MRSMAAQVPQRRFTAILKLNIARCHDRAEASIQIGRRGRFGVAPIPGITKSQSDSGSNAPAGDQE